MTVFAVLGLAIVVLILAIIHYFSISLWINAKVVGVNISLFQLFLMRIRKVPPSEIVVCMVEAHKANLKEVTLEKLEAHYLSGGNIERVVHAMIHASNANITFSFEMATAIDLAGKDVIQVVKTLINKKDVDTSSVANMLLN